MKVTDDRFKDRQLHKKGYLQKVSAEQRGYAEATAYQRIAENNNIIANYQQVSLLEKMLDRNNLNKAYKKVKYNKGAGGGDKMNMDELFAFLKNNKEQLLQQIKSGKYKSLPVKRVEIPKEEKGKFRKFGIPTVVDRVIQQAITQVLSPIFERQFSEYSYCFRPNRGAKDALKQCQLNVDEGYKYVVDMDLEKFFDTVCQSKLIEILSRTIEDGRVISLIHKYLNAGVVNKGLFEKTEIGVPQGGPLSPLLSNIMLNELDRELEKRGHRFVRYADDCMIFCKSKKSAERTLKNIIPYIEQKLFLKINRDKTVVAHISKVKYLGYSFYNPKGQCRFRVHPKSINKKAKLKELTSRNNGMGNEYRVIKIKQFIIGWANYFSYADMKNLLITIDKWLKRRIRQIYWKQWKKVKTRYKMLRHFGINKYKAWEFANTRKSFWRISKSPILSRSLDNKTIASLGYITLTDYYLKVCEN